MEIVLAFVFVAIIIAPALLVIRAIERAYARLTGNAVPKWLAPPDSSTHESGDYEYKDHGQRK